MSGAKKKVIGSIADKATIRAEVIAEKRRGAVERVWEELSNAEAFRHLTLMEKAKRIVDVLLPEGKP